MLFSITGFKIKKNSNPHSLQKIKNKTSSQIKHDTKYFRLIDRNKNYGI